MLRFVDKFVSKLDAKGRVSIPAKYRHLLAQENLNGFYCAPDLQRPVAYGYGEEFLAEYDRQMEGRDPFSAEFLEQSTDVFSNSHHLEFDVDGRVRLPEEIVAHAGIKEQVQFAGIGKRFEMWNPETYLAELAKRMESRRQRIAGVAT